MIRIKFLLLLFVFSCKTNPKVASLVNDPSRMLINDNWSFFRYENGGDSLIYDVRPEDNEFKDSKDADSKPEEAKALERNRFILKPWILPTGNKFIEDPAKKHERPQGWPGQYFPFTNLSFDDKNWERVTLPHDWAIYQDFMTEADPIIGGGMGRLPVHGMAWYRRKLFLDKSDADKVIYLDIDGAMSYSMVWINGFLAGGWPYGYNSYRIDITEFVKFGQENQIAIKLDNPAKSARWYPGGGLYRNVWIEKSNKIHIGQWGTFVSSHRVTQEKATIKINTEIENLDLKNQSIEVKTLIYELDQKGNRTAKPVAQLSKKVLTNGKQTLESLDSTTLLNPKLWGPPPQQKPNLYTAVTTLISDGKIMDEKVTNFGVRDIKFDPNRGIIVNGEFIKAQGVNQHHDLGALGAAFNVRAAERQLEVLKELGCNSIRMAHNPPAPELLDLTDKHGFLVVNEIFDVWERKKTPLDFHLVFPEWYEQDTRSFIRRDRNHPSVILWSYGNEVGEQYTEEAGAQLSKKLREIVKEEDPYRLTTVSMNFSKPDMPFTREAEVISLNYQGEGIRNAPAYKHLKGITTEPLYTKFRAKFPERTLLSSETSSALSTRGTYIFPVTAENSAPVEEGSGGDRLNKHVSAYELYTAAFGSSADKVFATQDQNPFIGGEWVWSGWDYMGEPTPYYDARSSYCGIIDLAGFPKDRFYLYQSRWRPDLKVAHLLPHWNWPDKIGQKIPVHLFTSGDEAELFLNGKSLGRKKKNQYEYRLVWNDVEYSPGTLKAVVYKNGSYWTESTVKTTGKAAKIRLSSDKPSMTTDPSDLSFITVEILDAEGNFVRNASNEIEFKVSNNGQILATDNGDPSDMNSFAKTKRKAFSGLALAIVKKGMGSGKITLSASSPGLQSASIEVMVK